MLILSGRLPVSFDRKFHLAGPVGAHGSVMWRSGRTGYHEGSYLEYGSVLDVMFTDVSVLAVADSYFPLRIEKGTPEQMQQVAQLLEWRPLLPDGNLYVLRGGDSVGYVMAGSVTWIDDPNGSTDERSVLLGGIEETRNLEVHSA